MNETLTPEFIRTLGYGVLRKAIHDPGLSAEKVRKALDIYSEVFPSTPYTRNLRYKYTWHRKLKRQPGPQTEDVTPIEEADREFQEGEGKDNILLVSHEMSNTGAPRALLTLAETLKSIGYNPVILTFRGGPLAEEAARLSIPVVADFTGEMELLFKGEENDLSRFLRKFPTIVLNTLEAIWHFPVAVRRMEIPGWRPRLVGWIHEAESAYGVLRLQKDFPLIAGLLDEVLIVGDHARAHAARYSTDAPGFRNFYYGIEEMQREGRPLLSGKDGRIHLLLAGTLEPRKGQRQAIEAMKILTAEERDRFTLHFAGGATSEKVLKMVEQYKGDDVIYHGALTHEGLMSLLEEMDGLLCPSLDDPMPIVCTEAFQLYKPVIVSDATGTASFIKDGENGFVVRAGDSAALAAVLRRLLRNCDRLEEIGRAGHAIYSDNFSPEAFRKQVLDFFPAIKPSTDRNAGTL